jgi:hypothetical protein
VPHAHKADVEHVVVDARIEPTRSSIRDVLRLVFDGHAKRARRTKEDARADLGGEVESPGLRVWHGFAKPVRAAGGRQKRLNAR